MLTQVQSGSSEPNFYDYFDRVNGALVGSYADTGQQWKLTFTNTPSALVNNQRISLHTELANAYINTGIIISKVSMDFYNNTNYAQLRIGHSIGETQAPNGSFIRVDVRQTQFAIRRVEWGTLKDSVTYNAPKNYTNFHLDVEFEDDGTQQIVKVYADGALVLTETYANTRNVFGRMFCVLLVEEGTTVDIDNLEAWGVPV